MNKVEPEHFEKLYAKIIENGRKPATAHQVHRTARTAFGEAFRRGHVVRNPVTLAKPPRVEEEEIEPFEIDDKTRTLTISRQLQRRTWEHGCDAPHACGAKYHKTEPCREGCKRHTRACPPPCPPDCTDHARWCPQRRGGGLVEAEVKSRARRRGIVLPEELYELLTLQQTEQDRERQHAGTEWHEGGLDVRPTQRPTD